MKDTGNLLTYNQWTCGEYENSPEIFTLAQQVNKTCTNKYSDIGEQSIKITKLAVSGSYSRIIYNQSIINKTVTASATIKTEDNSATFFLLELDRYNVINQKYVTIPSNSFIKVTLLLEGGTSNTLFAIQFNNNGDVNSFIHIDNISLTVS